MTLSPLNFRELTFLVVDDESLILDIVASMLQNLESKKVHKATSGTIALNFLSDSNVSIDCVISDHGMEPMAGLELLQHIREGRNASMVRDTRFVMLTGHGEAEVVRTAAALDVDGYAVKPVSQRSMIQTLTRAFNRKRILKAGSDYATVVIPAKLDDDT